MPPVFSQRGHSHYLLASVLIDSDENMTQMDTQFLMAQ